jgi:putative endopeptidase
MLRRSTLRPCRLRPVVPIVAALLFGPGSARAEGPARPFAYEEATVADLQAQMTSGLLTSRALTEAYVARIREVDPLLSSVLEVNPDALAIADALDAERKTKGARGPLHGIPVLVKDNIATADRMQTTAGSLALAGVKPPHDAFIVERLRAAGAVLLGKTNLSEWANIRSTHSSSGWSARGGQTKNPYALDRSPCGSSSGTGAAIAANLAAVGVGTETDGSIVCPGTSQSLVGLKPTVGLVSRRGIVPISHTQDTAGPMGRTVADVAALLSVMAAVDPSDPASAASKGKAAPDYTKFLDAEGLKGARIGIVRAKMFGGSPEADRVANAAIEVLKAQGAVIVDPADIPHIGEYDDPELDVLLTEFKWDLADYLKEWAPGAPVKNLDELIEWNKQHAAAEMPFFGQELFERAAKKGPLSGKEYKKSLEKCRKLALDAGLATVFAKQKLDALLAPTGGAPWVIDLITGDHFGMSSSTPPAVAGTPAITVPAGFERGLPLGVTFMGPAWSEGTLLRIAYAYEQASHARKPPRLAPTADLSAPAERASGPRGVYPEDVDAHADACTDFFEFANGAWRAKNPIPSSMVRWSRRWASGESAKEQLKEILDEVSAKTTWQAGSVEQLVGDHYAACMDGARIDALGARPVEPLLREIDALRDAAGVQRMIGRLHELAVDVPFGVTASPDNHDPTRVIANVYASGLGLPDRDYYLKPEPRFEEIRGKYLAHLAASFELIGVGGAAAKASAQAVFAVEKALAEASLDNVARRDPKATDHKTSFADLGKLVPRFDWAAYFDAAHLPRLDLNVREPKFLEEVNRQLADVPLATWKAYLKWHLIREASPSLAAPFVEESYRFYQATLGGAAEMKPRWKRCVESTDDLLGEALGRKYVEKYFPPEAKERIREMVKNLLLAMGDVIRGADWMTDPTKKKALEKLATFNPKLGYPDKWKDYSAVRIRRDAFWEDVAAGRRFNVADDLAQAGKPVDRGRWGMSPPTSNAYYNALLNEIVFPAGILQPPAFRMDATDAVSYGAIGVVIGHEISHGFDDQGAQFDAQGRLANWWTDEDLKKFQARGQCVVDQFEGYFIEPGLHHNGKLVLGESIGDLAGAKIAFLAYRRSRAGKDPEPTIDGFTPEQQFFIGWGQFRGDEIRSETQRRMVQGDPHPTGKYRVIGPLSNMPEFARAFSCKPAAPMVRPAGKRCEVW